MWLINIMWLVIYLFYVIFENYLLVKILVICFYNKCKKIIYFFLKWRGIVVIVNIKREKYKMKKDFIWFKGIFVIFVDWR